MSKLLLLLTTSVSALALAAAVPVPASAAAAGANAAPTQARLGGGRSFGGGVRSFRSPSRYGSRYRAPASRYRSASRYRRPGFWHGAGGSVLRALGIAYLLHLAFGFGPGGGSPLGLFLVVGLVLWLATRRRMRRAYYA
jgi:hypothetical protein